MINQKYLKKLERMFKEEGLDVKGYELEMLLDEMIENHIQAGDDEFIIPIEYCNKTVFAYGQIIREEDNSKITISYDGFEFVDSEGNKNYKKFFYED